MIRAPLVLLLLGACAAEAPHEAPVPVEPRVAWAAPEPADSQVLVTLPAEVEPDPAATTTIGPRVAGRIVSWEVRTGDAVRRGERLARLDSPALVGLAATVDGRRRARESADARLAAGVGTRADLAQADAELADAQATLDSARRTLTVGGGDAVWSSPVDGVIGALACSQGQDVGPGDACVVLVDASRVAVLARLPERHLARLDGATGRWVGTDGARVDALPLTSREPVADRASRTVALRFAVPAAAGLVPYTSGRVDVVVPLDGDAFTVPQAALTTLDGRTVVFARTSDGAEPLPVEVLGRDGEGTIVRGPLAGREIAFRGVFELKSRALLGGEDA
jgi:cobalt-zinc-cadmium efflux system membrane fusion protein